MKIPIIVIFLFATVLAGNEEDVWKEKNYLPPAFANAPDIKIKELQKVGVKIIGGSDVNIVSYPYQLSLQSRGSHICGASIISPFWALTAAHCVNPKPVPSTITLRGGSPNRLQGGVIFTAVQIEVHPQYATNTLDFDVAVIRVGQRFTGLNIVSTPIAQEFSAIVAGSSSVVSGWGLTNAGTLPQTLKAVAIPIVSQFTCSSRWGTSRITANMICAGQAGRDSCNGDSGGPLVQGGRQIGIVSWGSSRCGSTLPGVYTRIASPSIRKFIRDNTAI